VVELALSARDALLVVDLQRGFDDPVWGRRNNPDCEANVATLLAEWRQAGRPIVFVRHDSKVAGSPLAPGSPGNAFKPELTGNADLLVTKSVHSAFYGRPDLDAWLQEHEIQGLVVTGIATDHCCETTVRMAGDLGYRVLFAIDATCTFDRRLPGGEVVEADEVARVTAASLHNEFCQVVTTDDLLQASIHVR
jgi:nicotinamidase-related amidase